MARDEDKKHDAPVVEWGTVGWGEAEKEPAAEWPARPAPEPPKDKQPKEPLLLAAPPAEERERYEEHPPPPAMDWRDAPEVEGTLSEAQKKGGPLIGRGLLMLIAAGYLIFVAALNYEALGALHSEAASASGSRLVELQQSHETISKLTLGNAAAGGIFAIAGLFLLFGGRAFGKLLMFLGAAFLIGFLYLHFKQAQPFLREADLLYKLIILAGASVLLR